MGKVSRRDVLAGSGAAAIVGASAKAAVIEGKAPWAPRAGDPPGRVVDDGSWHFFTEAEARTVEALVDRIIPPDPDTPGGKDAGCAVFLDRQLAGRYGHDEGHYMQGPFISGTKQQGPQSSVTPAQRYRRALAALAEYCRQNYSGKTFDQLDANQQDEILKKLEADAIKLGDNDGSAFLKVLIQNTQEGFFADPIYGGNRGMVGWKMIGFPGARYDYRDWVNKFNQPYPKPPVSIAGSPDWDPKKS